MWKQYFKLTGIKDGEVIFPVPFGKVDFREDNIDLNKLRLIFEADHPYLKMTDAGMDHFYGDKAPKENDNVFSAKDLVASIKKATNEDQARYYLGLGKNLSSVQKAFDKRIKELHPGS